MSDPGEPGSYACRDCMRSMGDDWQDDLREIEAARKKLSDLDLNLLESHGKAILRSSLADRSTGESIVRAARALRLLTPEARAELGLRVEAGEGRFIGWSDDTDPA